MKSVKGEAEERGRQWIQRCVVPNFRQIANSRVIPTTTAHTIQADLFQSSFTFFQFTFTFFSSQYVIIRTYSHKSCSQNLGRPSLLFFTFTFYFISFQYISFHIKLPKHVLPKSGPFFFTFTFHKISIYHLPRKSDNIS